MESNTRFRNCVLVLNPFFSPVPLLFSFSFLKFIFETNQVTNVTANLVTKKRLMVTAKMLTNVLLVSTQNAMKMQNA